MRITINSDISVHFIFSPNKVIIIFRGDQHLVLDNLKYLYIQEAPSQLMEKDGYLQVKMIYALCAVRV